MVLRIIIYFKVLLLLCYCYALTFWTNKIFWWFSCFFSLWDFEITPLILGLWMLMLRPGNLCPLEYCHWCAISLIVPFVIVLGSIKGASINYMYLDTKKYLVSRCIYEQVSSIGIFDTFRVGYQYLYLWYIIYVFTQHCLLNNGIKQFVVIFRLMKLSILKWKTKTHQIVCQPELNPFTQTICITNTLRSRNISLRGPKGLSI